MIHLDPMEIVVVYMDLVLYDLVWFPLFHAVPRRFFPHSRQSAQCLPGPLQAWAGRLGMRANVEMSPADSMVWGEVLMAIFQGHI